LCFGNCWANIESMENHFSRIKDKQVLEELVKRSESEPVIIFKHSSACPVSAMAYEEMQHVGKEVHLVVVQSDREVSREIEAQTGLEHESPQVILLRRGKAVWDASHWKVKANAVLAAVQENA
jgi:bacillithiol system protein YtxJ